MKTTDENKSTQPTPEQLLKLLEVEIGASRQKRVKLESKRRTIQVVSIMVIVVGTAIALWVLMFMLEDFQSEHTRNASESQGMMSLGKCGSHRRI